MAYVYPNRTDVVSVPSRHEFIDPRTLNFPIYTNPFGVAEPSSLVPIDPVSGFHPNLTYLVQMEQKRSLSLHQYLENEGLVPSKEEELKRRNVIAKLKKIVLSWIKNVAWRHQLPKQQIRLARATILAYGSYGLGVHGSESDIDALCVGPFFATMEDFFDVLRDLLEKNRDISEMHCVKDAKVPLMRFKFDGISVDLPYARLQVSSVPEYVNTLDPFFFWNIDEISWKSLSGVRANRCILQLVPNLENFRALLRCVKFWAKTRGIYGNLRGFLGGVHLAILAALISQRHPNASLASSVSIFFGTYAFWPWPTPVTLLDGMMPPTVDFNDIRPLMPIRLPHSHEYCHSNITRSTFLRIREELLRGHAMSGDIFKSHFDWKNIFEPFPYFERYAKFLKISLSALDHDKLRDWVGWVKSRFRTLILKLEEVCSFCDPYPTENDDFEVGKPTTVFYWGLEFRRSESTDIKSIEEAFVKNLNNGYQDSPGTIKLAILHGYELPNSMQLNTGGRNGSKAYWEISNSSRQRIPLYLRHLPQQSRDHVAADKD
ncbi:Poly(A) polymerase, RNA-binding domain [Dillenia turbinata]|uniref:polynucleotide adenylyltransferase n=1 Tax=Dillenia turbinata TaxID=194707 RepID=A0AAN8V8G3_9MAGN